MTEPFVPFATERLTIRAARPDDADAVMAYRNDPDVARYQDWAVPYPLEKVRANIEDDRHVGERPVAGEAWVVAIDLAGTMIGDIYLGLEDAGAVATIGYTLARAHHGKGYAAEAVGAVIDRLLGERPQVHRINASVDPANVASIRLLESLGFTLEGIARKAALIRGEWLDDARYGLLREERTAWLARPTSAPSAVRLVEVTDANLRAVAQMATFGWQERLVAPNLWSLAQALRPGNDDAGGPLQPWVRAIEADGEPVGFVMLAAPTPTQPAPFLWRLMIDRRHQRRRIGQLALSLVIEQAVAWGTTALDVGWMPGIGSPAPFYVRNGFEPTGEVVDEEIFARLTLGSARPPRPGASR